MFAFHSPVHVAQFHADLQAALLEVRVAAPALVASSWQQ
jgi:hypothetical protein